MDPFDVHGRLVADYSAFTSGFTSVRDERIRAHVEARMAAGDQWPDPFVSLNPNFASGGSVSELVESGVLHPECERIFRVGKGPVSGDGQVIDLHQHQAEAVEIARAAPAMCSPPAPGRARA